MNLISYILQWVTLIRRHAEEVVNDEIVFPIFKKFCKVFFCLCVYICLDTLKINRLTNLIFCFVLGAEASATWQGQEESCKLPFLPALM